MEEEPKIIEIDEDDILFISRKEYAKFCGISETAIYARMGGEDIRLYIHKSVHKEYQQDTKDAREIVDHLNDCFWRLKKAKELL